MPRIEPVIPESAEPEARALLDDVQRTCGQMSNLIRTLGLSGAALQSYLALEAGAARVRLTPQLRERIALTVAGANGCSYAASVHTALGKQVGIEEGELAASLVGSSSDPAAAAVLRFTRAVVGKRGQLADDELEAVREAGFTDADLMEILTVMLLGTFGSYVTSVAGTTIDSPRVEAGRPIA